MSAKHIVRYGTIVLLLLSLLTLYIPQLTIVMITMLILLQMYIFFHADIFSGQTKGNAKWRTYRFLLFFVLCIIITIFYSKLIFKDEIQVMNYRSILLFMFMVVFGNLAPKLPYNRILGFRLPWTVEDEVVWRYTHRIVGYTSFPCACLLLIAHMLQAELLYGASIICWFLIPGIKSYQFYKSKQLIPKLQGERYL